MAEKYSTKETRLGRNVFKVERIKKPDDENLLKPGEDPGEGYRGSPDMYPDYEEDRKEAKALKNKDRNRNSSDKTKSMAYGGSVMVKTKLGRNKPTKIC